MRLNLAQSRGFAQPAARLDRCGKAGRVSLEKSAQSVAVIADFIAFRENSLALTQLIPMWE